MFNKIRELLEGAHAAGWLSPLPATKYENIPFTQPSNYGEYVELTITPGAGRTESLGNPKLERQMGVLALKIYQPKNSGTKRALELADTFSALFRNKQFFGSGVQVTMRGATPGKMGEEVFYYSATMVVPYEATYLFSN
jgi:hypothetical protein